MGRESKYIQCLFTIVHNGVCMSLFIMIKYTVELTLHSNLTQLIPTANVSITLYINYNNTRCVLLIMLVARQPAGIGHHMYCIIPR